MAKISHMTAICASIGYVFALCEPGVSQSLGLLNSASHPRNHLVKVEEDLSDYFLPFCLWLSFMFGFLNDLKFSSKWTTSLNLSKQPSHAKLCSITRKSAHYICFEKTLCMIWNIGTVSKHSTQLKSSCSLGLLLPNEHESDLSNEVLYILVGQESVRILKVNVGGCSKDCQLGPT